MVIQIRGLYFMVFTGRCYKEVLIKIGFTNWPEGIEVKLILPLVLICLGYQFEIDYPMTVEEVP
jgi:hypothetical protein